MPWRELDKEWFDTTVDYCDVCGNLLINRYWAFEAGDGEQEIRACSQRCENILAELREAREIPAPWDETDTEQQTAAGA